MSSRRITTLVEMSFLFGVLVVCAGVLPLATPSDG